MNTDVGAVFAAIAEEEQALPNPGDLATPNERACNAERRRVLRETRHGLHVARQIISRIVGRHDEACAELAATQTERKATAHQLKEVGAAIETERHHVERDQLIRCADQLRAAVEELTARESMLVVRVADRAGARAAAQARLDHLLAEWSQVRARRS